MSYSHLETDSSFFLCIRHFNILRIIVLFPALQKNLNNFLKALVQIYKIFIGLYLKIKFFKFYLGFFVLLLFYSFFGLYLFYGLEENLCRESKVPLPNSNEWPVLHEMTPQFCGDSPCEKGYFFLLYKNLIFKGFVGIHLFMVSQKIIMKFCMKFIIMV